MSEFTKTLKSNTERIGELILGPRKNRLLFDTHIIKDNGKIDRQRLISIGDVVYGLWHNGKLYKIGKAGGSSGLYDRMKQYEKYGKTIGPTNRKIVNLMNDKNIDKFEVRVMMCDRNWTRIKCPITNEFFELKIETANAVEQYLIQKAYRAGEKLPLCQEVKK
jgi:hypothetical protein